MSSTDTASRSRRSKTSSVIELTEERDFLLRSIEDLEREHAAGDVSDQDFEELRTRYVRQAAETLRALEAAKESKIESGERIEPKPAPMVRFRRYLGRRRARQVATITAVICVVGAVTLVAASLAGVRLPGENSSGSVNLPSATQIRDDLTDAQVLASTGNLTEALDEYGAVLKQVPNQPEALAYRGWLERLAGSANGSKQVIQAGDESIAEAIKVAPKYSDARAFEVIVLLEDEHAKTEALSEYATFLSTAPSSSLFSAIGPQMANAFKVEKVPVPAISPVRVENLIVVAKGEPKNRWLQTASRRGADYDKRFAQLAASGQYLHGEADFIEAFGVQSVLDAGCGTGRVAIELARRQIEVVGVDVDEKMLEAAREKAPNITWVEGDLATVSFDRTFDAIVMAGNVMIFVTPGTEGEVLTNLAAFIAIGGICIAGFSLEPGHLDVDSYEELANVAGLELVNQFSTWERALYQAGDSYAVLVHRKT